MKNDFTVWSVRRVTADKNHNAFTGAAWFPGGVLRGVPARGR